MAKSIFPERALLAGRQSEKQLDNGFSITCLFEPF